MKNCEPFIHHILNTTSNDLLLRFWRQQLQKEKENEAAADKEQLGADEYQSLEDGVMVSCHL